MAERSFTLKSEPTVAAVARPIRVLHMGSPMGLYGAERWILALIKHLPAQKVESWVSVIKDKRGVEAQLCTAASANGFRTHIFEAYGKLSCRAIKQLQEFILLNEIDIVHTHGYKTDIIGRLAVRGLTCKTVSTPHGWGANQGLRLKFYELLDRITLRFFDAVVPLSGEIYDSLRYLNRNGTKLQLIDNGVDLAEIDSTPSLSNDLAAVKARGVTVIGYVGRLDRGKRIDTLIRAVHKLPVEEKFLCIIGEGPERTRLQDLACGLLGSHQYEFMGFRDDRIAAMRSFDLFVLPSESEGIPRCLMEAMACGIAVIGADIRGCRELIVDKKTGLLFAPGDEMALLRQITRLLEDPQLREGLAQSGRSHVRHRFSAEIMALRYQRLYEQLVMPAIAESGTVTSQVQ